MTTLPHIGTPLPAHGGTLGAWMAYADGSVHGLIVSDAAHEFRAAWGPRKRVPGASAGIDGLACTQAMAKAGSKAAQRMLDLRIGGFDDWFLGNRLEMLALQQYVPDLFNKEWHWTSTQCAASSAWTQGFHRGSQLIVDLDYEAWCRPLRRLPLSHYATFDAATSGSAA